MYVTASFGTESSGLISKGGLNSKVVFTKDSTLFTLFGITVTSDTRMSFA